MRTVEASDPVAQKGQTAFLSQFDGKVLLRKTYLELLNLMPSKLSHTSITIWTSEVAEQSTALSMLSAERGGWWVCHFPTSEVDHVWRVVVNAHLKSKAFGAVIHLTGQSFRADSHGGGEVEMRVHVREADDVTELKRVGSSLLGATPSSLNKQHVLFLRGGLKEGARESKTKLEERADYKLAKEKRSDKERDTASTAKRPGNPFAITDPDRVQYQLFRIEKSGGVNWVKV